MYESTMFQGVAFKRLTDEAAFGSGDPAGLLSRARETGRSVAETASEYVSDMAASWRDDPVVLDAGEWRRADDREWAIHCEYCIEYVIQRLKTLPAIGFRRLPG